MPAKVEFQTRENPREEIIPDTFAVARSPPNRLPPLKQQPTLTDFLYKEKMVEEVNLQNEETKPQGKYSRKVG